MAKQLISEQSILEAAKRGEKILLIPAGAIVTAAARDRARQLGLKLDSSKDSAMSSAASTPAVGGVQKVKLETIAIGSDHGGFPLKGELKIFLESLGYKVVDLGTYTADACDYPDFAYAVARMVSLGEAQRGIMIDSVGVASAMVANKVPGIRAACCSDEFSARSSREHNDANVLTLGCKVVGSELAKAIVKVWVETWFGGGRHQKRVDKISEVEKRHLKS